MSARRNFLRDITMAIAASLVPRILQPAVPEVEDDVDIYAKNHSQEYIGGTDCCEPIITGNFKIRKIYDHGGTVIYRWEKIT